MRRIALLLVALAAIALPAESLRLPGSAPTTLAAQSSEGLCRLLTVKEVRKALGKGKWQIADDGDVPDQCYMHNGLMDRKSRAFSMRLLQSSEERQQEWREDVADEDGTFPMVIAGFPAVQDARDAVTVFFPDPWDILQLSPVGYAGQDVSEGVRQLAELAAGRFGSESGSSAVASPSTPPSGDASTDPCTLLTADEISAALGELMTVSPENMAGHCSYRGGRGVSLDVVVRVAPAADISMIERRRTLMPDATDLEVAESPALLVTDAGTRSQVVFVYPDEAVELTFALQTSTGDDVLPTLIALAELGVARALEAGLPVPPTSAPSPTAPVAAGLCAVLTIEEVAAALGTSAVTLLAAQPDGCVWGTPEMPLSVSLEVVRGDEAAELHQSLAMLPDTFEVGGMTAGQAELGSMGDGFVGSFLALLPDDSTAVILTVATPEGVDVAAVARGIAELVAPRLADHLAA
jgi:hypothetical protein